MIEADGPPLAQVFRTEYAGHTGKLSYARIWRGEIKDGVTLGGTRLGGVYHFVNGELSKSPACVVGDIVALGRLDGVPTGATVSPGTVPEQLLFPPAPTPVYALAVTTADRKDDVRLSDALRKLAEEDPALTVTQDHGTGETVMHGQGEMHLLNAIEHMARNYNLKMTTRRPSIAYRETIRAAVHEHGRLKRQNRRARSVRRREDRHRAARERAEPDFLFVDKVVGGAVPRNFIPVVGESAEEAAKKGPFGFPVVDISGHAGEWQGSMPSTVPTWRSAPRPRSPCARAWRRLIRCCWNRSIGRRSGTGRPDAAGATVADRPAGANPWLRRARGWPGWDDVKPLVPEAELR